MTKPLRLIIDRLNASDATMRVAQLRVLGGAMARVPDDATAFAHRQSRIMVNLAAFYDGPDDKARRESWVTDFHAAIEQDDTGAYVNFVVDEGDARIHAAYPGATWERLARSRRGTTRRTCSIATRTCRRRTRPRSTPAARASVDQ